ncbi:MAG TPA: hypothetical protein VF546_00230, partial [Pyrinomonadaceae bacterium]
MKSPLKIRLALLIACLLLMPAFAAAQSQQRPVPQTNSPESQSCYSTHSFGSGLNKFSFCISGNGTLINLVSPAGYKQLGISEGYVLCSAQGVHVYDSGSDSFGFDRLERYQPHGPNTFPLIMDGLTADRKFELIQTFEADAEGKSVTITMRVINNSNSAVEGVKLARYFDADLSNDSADDIFDADADSVWGRDSGRGAGHQGLMLTALTLAQPHTPVVEKQSDWGQTTAATCSPMRQ